MAKENSRVRINLQSGEVEIEGTEEFINEQARRLKTLVRNLREAAEATAAQATPTPARRAAARPAPARRVAGARKPAAAAKTAAKPAARAAKAAAKPAARARRKAAPKAAAKAPATKAAAPAAADVRKFATLLKKLPEKASDVDRLLVAGYYVATTSGDRTFATRDANSLLAAAGAKILNAAQAAKANVTAKRLLKVDRGRFQLTDDGLEYAKKLVGA